LFYDPLNLVEQDFWGKGNEATIGWLRQSEVKHGRIAQLAFLGNIITRAGIKLPGDIDYSGTSFSSIPNGWAAIKAIPGAGLTQLILFVGFLELGVMKDVTGEAEFLGDFRNGALDFGWDTFDEETKLSKRGIELNNGRAAMMGILGLMVHEQLGGSIPIVGEM
jgi:hypothetical protein